MVPKFNIFPFDNLTKTGDPNMKIENIELYPVEIENEEEFKIATGTSFTTENVVIKIESEGKIGWGNGASNGVTEETNESIMRCLKPWKEKLIDKDISIEDIWSDFRKEHPGDPSALAGLDTALHDLHGKIEGKRVFELYDGYEEEGVLTDRTIGIMDERETVEHAEDYIEQGFKAIKIKVGLDMESDIERIKAVRETVGSDIKIWVDANQGYSVEEAKEFCGRIKGSDIEFVEQPVDEEDLEGLKEVTKDTDLPIVADEAMKDHESAEEICSNEMADMVNIKLMKCGGLTGGRKIVDVIEDHGVDAMVGCMLEMEPSLGAAVHLFESSDNIKYADLDGHLLLPDGLSRGLVFEDGRLWTSDEPGIGVEVVMGKLEQYM